MYQASFLECVLDRLENLHVVLDTSGFASENVFERIVRRCQLMYFDVKLIDSEAQRFVGVENESILRNLRQMPELGVPFVIRIPLVPCITDTNENLSAIAATIRPLPGLIRVDLLPYNRAAGGKYGPLGMEFRPPFDESQPVNANCDIFADMGVSVNVPGRDRL